MPLRLGGCFSPHRGFLPPSTLILHSWGQVTWAQKFTVACVTSVTLLGMPDPRPDIRCVQYLPQVHKNAQIGFLATSGTSEVRDWHQRSNPSLDIEDGSKTSLKCQRWIQNIIDVEWRFSSSPTDVHTQGGTSTSHWHVPAPVESYWLHLIPLALVRATHFILKH